MALRLIPHALLAFLVFSLPASAQSWATRAYCFDAAPEIHDAAFAPFGREALEAQAARIPNGTGRFWQITAPNGARSHLWGTLHSSHAPVLDLPAPVRHALDNARLVALEIDATFPSRAALDRHLQADDSLRALRTPFTFSQLGLPRKIERLIGNRMIAMGFERVYLDFLTLGTIAEMLLSDPCDDFTGGIIPVQDRLIHTIAHINDTPILGLEPADRLRKRLDAPDGEALGAAMIATYASYLEPKDDPAARQTGLGLYLTVQIALMDAWDRAYVTDWLGEGGRDMYDLMSTYLVDERNVDLVTAALDALHEGGVFIAVGASHLPGETGMIAILQDHGFQVTRLPLTGETP